MEADARKYTVTMILAVDSLQIASLVAGVAGLGYLGAAAGGADARWPVWALVIGWLAHAVLLASDMGVGFGTDPGVRFGFAPVLSATMWLVIGVHEVESRFVPMPAIRRVLAVIALATVVLVAMFPGERPVVSHSPWAPLHWILGIVSYALFGAAVLHGALLDTADRQMRTRAGAGIVMGMPLLKLERLTFRFVDAGFVVLTAAIAVGIGTVAQWRWQDHKVVFSLLSWATFMALIVGRRWQGWRGRHATRWLYGGAVLLLLAYVGSRFVFEVLLQRAPPVM